MPDHVGAQYHCVTFATTIARNTSCREVATETYNRKTTISNDFSPLKWVLTETCYTLLVGETELRINLLWKTEYEEKQNLYFFTFHTTRPNSRFGAILECETNHSWEWAVVKWEWSEQGESTNEITTQWTHDHLTTRRMWQRERERERQGRERRIFYHSVQLSRFCQNVNNDSVMLSYEPVDTDVVVAFFSLLKFSLHQTALAASFWTDSSTVLLRSCNLLSSAHTDRKYLYLRVHCHTL